jgi:predicted enzyme related to lactoylglutathione lyase
LRWCRAASIDRNYRIMIKRFDRLDVAASDLDDAASIYEKNFGFKVTRSGENALVSIGGAEIRLASGAAAADAIKANGEGMFGVWLEADDVEQVVASLKKAGVEVGAIKKEAGRRILSIDPKSANLVPLFIFDSKG